MRKIALILSVLFVGFSAAAQNRPVSGTVTDSNGDPLIGVIVVLQGTTNAVTTDTEGRYSLNVPSDGSLNFSLLGMTPQTVAIGGRSVVDVVMQADALAIAAVSVYGTSVSQHAISGSVSSLKSDAITSTTTVSFDQALAGKMAGVQVTTTSGVLAEGTSIRVRGTNSISNSSQPLFVVDGVPLTESTNLNITDGGHMRFNPMASINTNDIQSIEVLKDAAAAALYGSRAANGVILITTKRGQAGRAQVSYNSYVSMSQAVNLPRLLNADQYIEIKNEAATNLWGAGNDIAAFPESGRVETDWMDLTFRKAVSQNHSMSVSGGTDKLSFYGSADWLDQKGVVRDNYLDRYSFRATVDATPTKWLKAGISVNYSKTRNNGVRATSQKYASITYATYAAFPNVAEKNPDGSYNLDSSGGLGNGGNKISYKGSNTYNARIYHPTASMYLQHNTNIADRIGAIAYATITPVKGLSFTSKIGIDNVANDEQQYNHPSIAGAGFKTGRVDEYSVWINQWNWQNFANFNTTLGENHNIGAMVGVEYEQRDYKRIFAYAKDFVSSDFHDMLDNMYTEQQSGGTMNSRGFASMFANASYNYAGKYYLDVYFRRDGSSAFGANKRYGNFPGGSLAWRIGDENFMESSKSWLSDLKVRTSYGIVGNSNIGNYSSKTLYGAGKYADVNGLYNTQVGDPDISWETSRKFDVGFDASFLRGRIDVAFDYWRTDVNNMLLAAVPPDVTGMPDASVDKNIGSMNNKGIELQINTQNYTSANGAFSWTSSFNLTTVKNTVTKLYAPIAGTNYVIEGQPMGVWWVYEWAGVDPETGRPGFIDGKTGRVKYYDASPSVAAKDKWTFADGDKEVAPALSQANDAKFIDGVNGAPTWYGNFDNTFRYRNLDLNIGLQFAGGNRIMNTTRSALLEPRICNNSTEILSRWQKPGDVTEVPRLVHGVPMGLNGSATHTRFLEKGDFLRIREVTLAYNLPQLLTDKLGVTGRVYFRANNLHVFTAYTGSDPEISSNINSNYTVGNDNRTIPALRTFTLGLNLNF